MKICFKCNTEKSFDCFYKHKGMADGCINKCKDCSKKESDTRYKNLMKDEDFVLSEKNRNEKRRRKKGIKKLEKLPVVFKERWRNYFAKYPEKYSAYIKTQYLRSSFKDRDMHHWSYKNENSTDLLEILTKDHHLLHKHIKYYQPEMCYKSKEGHLLDTRKKHIDYLTFLKIKIFNHEYH